MNLLAIARSGSFTRAAKTLGISQPALSNCMAQLEHRVRERVLTRSRQGVTLTDAGEILVRYAQQMEIQSARAVNELKHKKIGVEGPLVLGVMPVATAVMVPAAIGRLRREYPKAVLTVLEFVCNYDEAIQALRGGALDILVGPIGVYPRAEEINEERLLMDPLYLIFRDGHPMARRSRLSIRDVDMSSWALPSQENAFRHQLEALFVVAGLEWPSTYVSTNSMTALKSIVMNSDCATIMPRQVVTLERKLKLLATVPLVESGAARALGMSFVSGRTLAPLAQRFVQILRTIAQEHCATVSSRKANI